VFYQGKIHNRAAFLNPDKHTTPDNTHFKCHRKTVRRLEVGYGTLFNNINTDVVLFILFYSGITYKYKVLIIVFLHIYIFYLSKIRLNSKP